MSVAPVRGAVVLAIAMAVAVLLAGCVTGERPSFGTDQVVVPLGPLPTLVDTIAGVESVGIIGDSITAASADVIRYVLTGKGINDVTIDAVVARRIDVGNGLDEPLAGVKTLERLLAEGADPQVWVIALGTNDVGLYDDAEAYGQIIDGILQQIPVTTPLVWIDAYVPIRLAQTDEFNGVLRSRIAARGNAVVGSWQAVASRPDANLLQSDGLHPNTDGLLAFAVVIANALADLP